jgi:hypothetical protein
LDYRSHPVRLNRANDFPAVSYAAPGKGFGLALYHRDGNNWAGVWTFSGGKAVG